MAKRTKKLSKSARPLLKLEALEQRQLLAGGFTTAQGQEFSNITHSNGNVYDQVLLKTSAITVTNDAGQITRVSFLDLSGDIVQAEFGGAGQLSISLDGFVDAATPTKYAQADIKYVSGNASFTIQGSDSTTNFTVFSVGTATANGGAANPIFAGGLTGGNNIANVANITIVANPLAPNGSTFGGIKAGNAYFGAATGVVGIAAANVQVQGVVTVGDINASGTASPTLAFGTLSQFGAVTMAGGSLLSTNGKAINNTGSYVYGLTLAAGGTSGGAIDAAETNLAALTFTGVNVVQSQLKTFTLTTGIDSGTAFTGGSGDDSFVATDTTLGALDSLNGGGGNDTLTVNDAAGATASFTNVTVAQIEALNMISTKGLNGGALDTTIFSGLTSAVVALGQIGAGQTVTGATTTSLTVNVGNQTTNPLSVQGGSAVTLTSAGSEVAGGTATINIGGASAPTGAVVLTNTQNASKDYAGANIAYPATTIVGGTTVSVTQGVTPFSAAQVAAAAPNAVDNFSVTQGAVTVTGKSTTTSVSVSQTGTQTEVDETTAGESDGRIGVVAGAVTVTDANAGSATSPGTITAVTLAGYGAASSIDSSALTTVTLSGRGGTLSIGRGALTATPTANTLALNVSGMTGTNTITDAEAAADDGFVTLNIASTGSTSAIANIVAADVTTLNISGSANLTLTSIAGLTALTSVTSTSTSGVTLSTVLPVGATYTGAGGADSITVAAATVAITTGAGNDTVVISTAALGTGGTVDAGDGTQDVLSMTGANMETASATSVFEGTISNFERVTITAPTTNTINLANVDDISYVSTSGATALTLNGMGANGTLVLSNAGTAYTVNLSDTSGAADTLNVTIGNRSVATTYGTVTAAGVETINLVSDDTTTTIVTPIQHTVALSATAAKTLTITGDAGVILTITGDTALTAINASALSQGALTLAAVPDFLAAATITGGVAGDTINATAATKAVTLIGGAGNDALTAGSSATGNSLSGGDGNDALAGGAGADAIDGGAGDDIIMGGAGLDVLTGGAGKDSFTILPPANGNSYATITDLGAGDTITVTENGGTEVFTLAKITLADTAVFQDFIDAAASGNGGTNSVLRSFQFGGNTYLVQDASAATTYQNGVDTVVRINGLVDLSTATGNGTNILTIV